MSKTDSTSVIQGEAKPAVSGNVALIEKCFEYYYKLGPNRSLLPIEKASGVPLKVLKDWCEGFAWDEKITERDKDINKEFEQHYRTKTLQIRNRLVNQMEQLMDGMENSSLGLPFAVTCVADFKQLAQAYESLVRANIMSVTKAPDLMGSDKQPQTWAELLSHASGDRPEGETTDD